MGAFVDFSKAVCAALKASTDLTAVAGANKVFNDVPVQGEASAPAFPYVVVGEQQGTEAGTDGSEASEMQITIDAWSRGAGNQQALAMLDAIRDALHNKSHFVAKGVMVYLYYLSHETLRGNDGETYQGVIRFRGLYQYG